VNEAAMNFQQLRFVREAARHDFNLTEVGMALHTTQSGVSKCIRELEAEVGVEIFVRHGRRIVGWTPAGAAMAEIADRILDEVDAFKQCALTYRTGRNPAAREPVAAIDASWRASPIEMAS
jgi:LysR family cys regulon transcriptional activator